MSSEALLTEANHNVEVQYAKGIVYSKNFKVFI